MIILSICCFCELFGAAWIGEELENAAGSYDASASSREEIFLEDVD
jgi:hypothetical protein